MPHFPASRTIGVPLPPKTLAMEMGAAVDAVATATTHPTAVEYSAVDQVA
jgi:hypothetical protein